MSYRISGCQSCKGNVVKFLDLGNQPPPMVFGAGEAKEETTWPLEVGRCSHCGLVQNLFIVDPKLLFGAYQYNSAATPSFRKHLDDLAETVTKRFSPKFVVDIGCNDGSLLESFRQRGAVVLGVEPSEIAALAKEKAIPVANEFFTEKVAEEIVEAGGQADIITATNVFGHVADLDGFVKGVHRLLKPEGVFVSEHTFLLDMIQKLEYDVVYHEHLRHYSLMSLHEVLSRRGFEIFDAERIPTFGGSIRVFAEKASATMRENSPSMLAIGRQEDLAGLNRIVVYVDFAEKVKRSKVELNRLLYALKAEGRSIIGVGAPARASTLLGYCGIDSDLLDYVAETSELKIGRTTPMTHIPVVSEERIFADQPDYALLLSWHLADFIIPSLRSKGYHGCFIVPLPSVKVIE